MMLRASFIQNRKNTKESVCHTNSLASFCMKKVTLPASSYDAASVVHTKLRHEQRNRYVIQTRLRVFV